MNISNSDIIKISDAYLNALSGSDVASAIRLHATKAGVNISLINFQSIDRFVVFNVIQAAWAQNKLLLFLEVVEKEGFELNNDIEFFPNNIKLNAFPQLIIEDYIKYFPASLTLENRSIKLLSGQIINLKSETQRVFIHVSLVGFADTVKLRVDIPTGGSEIPDMRFPRVEPSEARLLSQTITPVTINVDLYVPGNQAAIDTFQGIVWLSQPDIVLIAEKTEHVLDDYSPILSLWVNSGTSELADILTRILPSEIRNRLGYQNNYLILEKQVRALFDGLNSLGFTYLPTELVWIANGTKILQRVRRPDDILKDPNLRINCLDGSILFASFLEYMGLDPIIVLIQNHALVGWKITQEDVDTNDPENVFRSCGLVDITYLCGHMDFDVAVSAAQGHFIRGRKLFSIPNPALPDYSRILDIKNQRKSFIQAMRV